MNMALDIMNQVLEDLDIEQSSPEQLLDVKDVARYLMASSIIIGLVVV